MRFAVTAKYKKLCDHFDHSAEFAILDVEDNRIVTENFWSSPSHEFGNLPEWLRYEMKVDVVVAADMSQKMKQFLAEKGIQVVSGATGECPRTIVENYLEGSPVTGANL